jgi:aspartyl-tRNA(Asn)/glutamyl-tRNA(Gln) amidotransferase subunit C
MLSREEVLKIARLARLELTDAELALYQTRLGRVLEYINELKAVSTTDAGFVRHVPKDAVAFREDKVQQSPYAAAILENAPEVEDSHFLLPAVLEGDA